MIIGENAKDADLDVNIVREKKLTTCEHRLRILRFGSCLIAIST